MKIAFDLDGVICKRTSEDGGVEKYNTCYPDLDVVKIVNELTNSGNQVFIYTARGMNTFDGDVSRVYDNLYSLTKNQLKNWGVNYTQLIMGKASYDLLIDDKALNSKIIKSTKTITDFLTNNES